MWGLNAGLVETLSLVLRTHVFTSTLLYFHNDVNFVNLLYYLLCYIELSKFNYFSGSFLATESPWYIAGCESRQQLQASDIFRETPG